MAEEITFKRKTAVFIVVLVIVLYFIVMFCINHYQDDTNLPSEDATNRTLNGTVKKHLLDVYNIYKR